MDLAEIRARLGDIEREVVRGPLRSEAERQCCRLQAEIDQVQAEISYLDAAIAQKDAREARIAELRKTNRDE